LTNRIALSESAIPPVRVGDQVEVKYGSTWYDAVITKVLSGEAEVDYQSGTRTRSSTFKLKDIRFPNGEGHWREWADASGQFKIVARYISRTATEVTIRKEDGSEVTLPIDRLSASQVIGADADYRRRKHDRRRQSDPGRR
jgi:hypothetical protein